ncbi:FAD-binding oxidoreductase [Fodinicurvata sp. EGI_FJ10296]|uniref:NAD(P)/FAD-dependent oxidoreductase n=1 Tax=Fodinicurvata sp. EGI_FJ10296 TaxID=3231908 RepID=UPI0034518BEA
MTRQQAAAPDRKHNDDREPHPNSWYAATARHEAPAAPPLQGATKADVAVVGGGFTGLSTALTLAERGFDVVVLEGRRIGWGASGRNGGQIIHGFNKSLGEIAAISGPDDARKLYEMECESRRLIAERVDRFAIDCDLKWGSMLAAVKPRQMDYLRQSHDEWAGEYGYRSMTLVERPEMADYVNVPAYHGGLFDQASGHLHPLNYALGLAAACRRAGVRFHENSMVSGLDDGPSPSVVTETGRVDAKFVVLAGNAYMPKLNGPVARTMRPRFMPTGTYMIATEPLGEDRARHLFPKDIAVSDCNFVLNYYRLSADKRMLFGGGVSYSTLEPRDLGASLHRTMCRYFPDLTDTVVDYVWGGHVAITRNRLPHLGRLSETVYFAQGYSGHGVALTGIAGQVIAEAIAGAAERFDVFDRIPHNTFHGGEMFRTPLLVLAMGWYRLRDML